MLPMIVQYKNIPLLDNYSQRKKDDASNSRENDEISKDNHDRNEQAN